MWNKKNLNNEITKNTNFYALRSASVRGKDAPLKAYNVVLYSLYIFLNFKKCFIAREL